MYQQWGNLTLECKICDQLKIPVSHVEIKIWIIMFLSTKSTPPWFRFQLIILLWKFKNICIGFPPSPKWFAWGEKFFFHRTQFFLHVSHLISRMSKIWLSLQLQRVMAFSRNRDTTWIKNPAVEKAWLSVPVELGLCQVRQKFCLSPLVLWIGKREGSWQLFFIICKDHKFFEHFWRLLQRAPSSPSPRTAVDQQNKLSETKKTEPLSLIRVSHQGICRPPPT